MRPPPETQTTTEQTSNSYLTAALAAITALSADPRIDALARSVEPVGGEMDPTILALIEALDAADCVAFDECEEASE